MRFSHTWSGGPAAVTVAVLLSASAATATPDATDYQTRVNETLGLSGSTIFQPVLDAAGGERVVTIVPIDGTPVVIELDRHSVRADGYQLYRTDGSGALVAVAPGPVRTLRGSVLGHAGSFVAGSLLDDGLHARVALSPDDVRWIEPIGDRVAGGQGGEYVLYRSEDVIETGKSCGVDAAMRIPGAGVAPGGGPVATGGGLCTAQLACDADFEYFQDYGSVGAVEARINSIINTVNAQYQDEVGITHVITAIIVRTSEPDPYTSTDAVTLLNQFRNQWLGNHGGIQRSVAELFTGKEINGGTIGIAWLNAVCTSYGYNMVQSDFNGSFGCATDLSAHELGHNWGADHCNCTSNTMNPYITCANHFSSIFSVPDIVGYRDSVNCLDCGGGPVTGACCVGNDCLIRTAGECSNLSGTYLGDNSDCGGNPCSVPDPTGACCAGGTCTIETEADCLSSSGTYQGDDSVCTPNLCGGGGGPVVATLVGLTVTQGGITCGGLGNLAASDDSDLCVLSTTSGSKRRSNVIATAASPHPSVSSMIIVLESAASTNNVKSKLYLRRVNNNKWTRIASFTQSQSDTTRTYNISDPNRFVDGNGDIEVRIFSEKRNSNHTVSTDLIEVTVEP